MPSPVNFLIVHGAYGSPERNWFPWLVDELQKYGKVFQPRFPTPENQNRKAWLEVADKALAGADASNTVLIGHSSGSILVLGMAERTSQPFKSVFAVCPFARDLGNEAFDPLNTTFYNPALDWKKIERGAGKIVVFAGDDDPYVPLAYSEEVADAVGAELITIEKGGHLNADSGYLEFPALLEKICEEL